MPGIRQCSQTNRCKILSASVFCFAVVVYAVLVSVWISTLSRNVERDQDLNNKKQSLACHICFTYSGSTALDEYKCKSIERSCEIKGWRKRKSLPASCKNDPKVNNFVKKEVRRVFDETKTEFESKKLEPDELEYLQTAEQSFYAPSRTIIHWSPTAKAYTHTDTEEWQTVEEFCHDRTTYTISPGNTNSYSNGTVNITETGLYLIYARLTFACKNPDHQKKRIHMEVVVQGKQKTQKESQKPNIILKDMQTATCSVKDDLLTMYQSGIFRLAEDNKIELRYKIPANVTLSNGATKLYKSSIGLIRLGLA